MIKAVFVAAILFLLTLARSVSAFADTPLVAKLAISGGAFVPEQLRLPAGVQVKLEVRNDDALPAEFESYDLSREVVVPPHTRITTYVGPLKPGRYRFFDDFNHAIRGEVVVEGSTK